MKSGDQISIPNFTAEALFSLKIQWLLLYRIFLCLARASGPTPAVFPLGGLGPPLCGAACLVPVGKAGGPPLSHRAPAWPGARQEAGR